MSGRNLDGFVAAKLNKTSVMRTKSGPQFGAILLQEGLEP
jgi:hypothetical protein